MINAYLSLKWKLNKYKTFFLNSVCWQVWVFNILGTIICYAIPTMIECILFYMILLSLCKDFISNNKFECEDDKFQLVFSMLLFSWYETNVVNLIQARAIQVLELFVSID